VFLAHILTMEDIDLLQQFCGQLLIGVNHSQKILVLTGDSRTPDMEFTIRHFFGVFFVI